MLLLLRILLLFAFSICYLNFGHDGGSFIAQAEYDLVTDTDKVSPLFFNPLFIISLIGQVLILASMFDTLYSNRLTISGIILLGIIVIGALLLGFVTDSLGAIISTIPFMIVSIIYFSKKHLNKKRTGDVG